MHNYSGFCGYALKMYSLFQEKKMPQIFLLVCAEFYGRHKSAQL